MKGLVGSLSVSHKECALRLRLNIPYPTEHLTIEVQTLIDVSVLHTCNRWSRGIEAIKLGNTG